MTQPQGAGEQPPDKSNQRRARRKLTDFLKRLRKACDTISSVNDWIEITGELNRILDLHQAEIPGPNRQRLAEALELSETSREAISQACDALQIELERTIEALPRGGCSCGCLAAGAALLGLLAALVLVVAAFAFLAQPVEVTVVNGGCRNFLVRQGIPPGLQPAISLLGIDLPEEIRSGEQGGFGIPGLPLSVMVDGTAGRSVRVSGFGISQSFEVSPDVVFIEVDGMPVLGNTLSVGIQDRNPHTVLIACE